MWLAYVEPQYENEYSRMLAAQRTPHLVKQFDDEQIEQQRGLVKEALGKLNQNVAIPMPKTISVLKLAINI